MLAADLMKSCEEFVASHAGITIELQVYPSSSWLELTAPVQRQPTDELGNVLQNRIRVFLPKSLVPSVNIKLDKVRVAAEAEGDSQIIYTLTEILASEGGHYWVECTA